MSTDGPNMIWSESLQAEYQRPDWRWRAVVIGFGCVIAITVGGCFACLIRYDLIGTGHLPRAALWPVLMLVGLNAMVVGLKRVFLLRRSELLMIYFVILCTCAIPGQQFQVYWYTSLLSPVYYSTPQNQYFDLFVQYYAPREGDPPLRRWAMQWLLPATDPESPVVKWAFEGMPKGVGGKWWIFPDVPPWEIWRAWIGPMIFWTPFFWALFFTTLCIAALVRKQWVERERLLFPLAEIPLAVTDSGAVWTMGEAGRGSDPPLFRNRLFWMCLAIPCVVFTINALNFYPKIESSWFGRIKINLEPNLGNMFGERPWNALNWTPLPIFFDMIAIIFLVGSDVGFSIWFFNAMRKGYGVASAQFGWYDPWRATLNYWMGGMWAMTLFYFWTLRKHLAAVARKALWGSEEDDSAEPLSYRMAFWGTLGGGAVLVGFCWLLGMSLHWAVLLFVIHFGLLLLMTRMVSEVGMFVFWLPRSENILMDGAGGLGVQFAARDVATMGLVGYQMFDSASNVMPNALQAFKVGGEARMNNRKVFLGIALAIVVALLACHIPTIYIYYRYTAPHFGGWAKASLTALPNWTMENLVRPLGYRGYEWGQITGGAVFAWALAWMRQKFLWWPFHPLGFATSIGNWWGDRYGFSVFLGWLAKVTIMNLGGPRLWRRARPAAIGLLVGNVLALFTWLLIMLYLPPGDKRLVGE